MANNKKRAQKPIKEMSGANASSTRSASAIARSLKEGRSLHEMDQWLKTRQKPVLLLFIFFWALLRIVFFVEISRSPLYDMYKWSESDNRFFVDWAKYLNTDWLNREPYHPYVFWHKNFADYFFRKHPEKLSSLVALHKNDSTFIPGKELWNEWYGQNQYHQEPLYPYMLAIFYRAGLDAIRSMIILQLLLGVVSGALLYLITKKYFGETVAFIAGVIYLFCGILMYNEAIILRTSWMVFFTVLNVFLAERVFSRGRAKDYFLCGLGIGLSFLMQSTFVLFLAGIVIICYFTAKQSLPVFVTNSAMMALGFFLMFSPVIARNIIVGAPTFSTSSAGPLTFVSNNVYGQEVANDWTASPERDAEIIAKSWMSFGTAIVNTLRTYPSVSSFLKLLWIKLEAIWNGTEWPNNESFYFYRQFLPALNLAGINFFLLGPLGLAGVFISILYRKKLFPLYLAVIINLAVLLSFLVLARLRAPLVALSIPFAAFAFVELLQWKVRQEYFAAALLVGILLFFSFKAYDPKNIDSLTKSRNFFLVLRSTFFEEKLKSLSEKKDWAGWLAVDDKFLDMAPRSIKDPINERALTLDDAKLLGTFGWEHRTRYDVFTEMGANASADSELEKSVAMNKIAFATFQKYNYAEQQYIPAKDIAHVYSVMAQSSFNKNNHESAISYLKNALEYQPDDTDLLLNLGVSYLVQGKNNEAVEVCKKVLEKDAKNRQAMMLLSEAYSKLGNRVMAAFYKDEAERMK